MTKSQKKKLLRLRGRLHLQPEVYLPLEADPELNLGAGAGPVLVEFFREVPFPRQRLQAHSTERRGGTEPLLSTSHRSNRSYDALKSRAGFCV